MAILDLLKRNRAKDDEEEDEEVGGAGGDDEGDDEDGPSVGRLAGRLAMLRGVTSIRGSASGLLGRVIRRGADDDEDYEDDVTPVPAAIEVPGPEAAGEELQETDDAPGPPPVALVDSDTGEDESAGEDASEEAPAAEISLDEPVNVDGDDGTDLALEGVAVGTVEIDQKLRELALSLEDSKVEQLSDDAVSLLNKVRDMLPE